MPRSASRFAGFLYIAVLAFPSLLAGQAPTPPVKPNRTTIARLEKAIPELMQNGEIPGLSIALIRDGKTYWAHGFGIRDVKNGQPVSDETTFEAASLSKPVFAYAVLKLVDQGKLKLDAPLSQYLPAPYINGDPRINQITARYVLSHRTGFPNWRGDGKTLTIHFTPGERFSYSGEGFVYLAKVVEQITGKPLNDFMTDSVFAPLGMASSSFVWRGDYDGRTATGHDDGGAVREKWKPKEANPASSLQTTAEDYALFIEAVMRGTGLKDTTVKEMEAPQVAVDPQCTNCTERMPQQLSKSVFWGLGWGIEQAGAYEALWHWGDNGAFKCFALAYPKQKIGVVMFTNSENGLAIASDIVTMALGGEHPAFDWLKYDRYYSPAMGFARAVREKGAAEAIAQFRTSLVRGDIPEGSINSIGYRLLWGKKQDDAVRIFQLNTELHPKSSNAYDSLAEAYMNSGEQQLAIENYERSLELDGKNSNAIDKLKKLRENGANSTVKSQPNP